MKIFSGFKNLKIFFLISPEKHSWNGMIQKKSYKFCKNAYKNTSYGPFNGCKRSDTNNCMWYSKKIEKAGA